MRAERLSAVATMATCFLRRRVMRQDEIDLIGDQGLNQILGRADADMEANVGMVAWNRVMADGSSSPATNSAAATLTCPRTRPRSCSIRNSTALNSDITRRA